MRCGRLQERSAAPSPRRNRLAASKRTGERRNGLYKGETVCRRDKQTVDGKSVLILEFYGRMEEEEEEKGGEGGEEEAVLGVVMVMRRGGGGGGGGGEGG